MICLYDSRSMLEHLLLTSVSVREGIAMILFIVVRVYMSDPCFLTRVALKDSDCAWVWVIA